jgi:hypothetical protein
MANPLLNDKAFGAAANRSGTQWSPPRQTEPDWHPPIDDGPRTAWQTPDDRMSVSGTAQAAALLFGLLLIAAAFGWAAVSAPVAGEKPTFPGIALIGVLVGIDSVIVSTFKPQLAL